MIGPRGAQRERIELPLAERAHRAADGGADGQRVGGVSHGQEIERVIAAGAAIINAALDRERVDAGLRQRKSINVVVEKRGHDDVARWGKEADVGLVDESARHQRVEGYLLPRCASELVKNRAIVL